MIFYRREQSEVMVFLFKVWFYGFLLEKLITAHLFAAQSRRQASRAR
jgi:hypothetical protein